MTGCECVLGVLVCVCVWAGAVCTPDSFVGMSVCVCVCESVCVCVPSLSWCSVKKTIQSADHCEPQNPLNFQHTPSDIHSHAHTHTHTYTHTPSHPQTHTHTDAKQGCRHFQRFGSRFVNPLLPSREGAKNKNPPIY